MDDHTTKYVGKVYLTMHSTWKAISIPLPIGEYHILIEGSAQKSIVMIDQVNIIQTACNGMGKT